MPKENITIPFSLLLNLASVCHAEDPEIIWGFIEQYSPGSNLKKNKFLENMVNLSVVYFNDMIKPNKKYRLPDDNEIKALKELSNGLTKLEKSSSSEEIQKLVFLIGKETDVTISKLSNLVSNISTKKSFAKISLLLVLIVA